MYGVLQKRPGRSCLSDSLSNHWKDTSKISVTIKTTRGNKTTGRPSHPGLTFSVGRAIPKNASQAALLSCCSGGCCNTRTHSRRSAFSPPKTRLYVLKEAATDVSVKYADSSRNSHFSRIVWEEVWKLCEPFISAVDDVPLTSARCGACSLWVADGSLVRQHQVET